MTVQVLKTSPQTLREDISRVLQSPEFGKLCPGNRTLIKINANYDRNWPGCNTSKWFLDALLFNLRKAGFEDLTAIEGDLKLQPALRTVKEIGIDRILNKYGVPFQPIENLPRENELPLILKDSQLISTPVLHTHTFAVISIAAKNLYGLLPVYREKYHNELSEKLLHLCKQIKVFSIVDGTVGLQGGSMRMGDPVKTDLILSGWDPIAIDAISAKIMGFSIDRIPYLKLAKSKGLIEDISFFGDFPENNLPNFNFSCKTPSIARFDLWIRNNGLFHRIFVYNSPFDIAANRGRRTYTSMIYHLKKGKVTRGDWSQYEQQYMVENQ
jgi:uncharacterized protein (DUF362 family)